MAQGFWSPVQGSLNKDYSMVGEFPGGHPRRYPVDMRFEKSTPLEVSVQGLGNNRCHCMTHAFCS